MIEVNVETYVSVAEADEYAGKYYMAADEKRKAWEGLAEADKETALRNAAMAIDGIIYPGRKKSIDQAMEFPRCYKNGYYFPLSWYETYTVEKGSWHCMIEIPEKIKHAQIEEAMELVHRTADSDNFDAYNSSLQSFEIAGLKERYNASADGAHGVKASLRSSRAQRWMSKYIGGGFHVN
ncbi:MAG: DnaT-like ssDNA-binding protein [Eubacteriales bacterium]